ncbi:MAG: DUF4268 domain-containing protein [Akkermansiaceae bacterium]|nr:DUF4268 domain-containing protein [Akkermansiaceae bacterium]
MNPLGMLESVNIREVWQGEASHFTPWLARPENLERLGEALAMSLEPVSTETPVGPFNADIVCSNLNDASTVLIENQLERTDHRHLGQIFTYAAGLDAVTIIWISPQFTEEHRAAIDWLNRITQDEFSFFGVEIELWRIGNSPPAPKFNIVAKPNDWTRAMRRKRPDGGTGGTQVATSDLRLQQISFWEGFQDYLTNAKSPIISQKPGPRHWMWHSIGRSGLLLCSIVNAGNRNSKSEIRAEFAIVDDPSGSRLEALRGMEEELRIATGEEVYFEPNPDTAKRSKFFVRRDAEWAKPEEQQAAFEWLDAKHRAILKVIRPSLQRL